MDRFGIFKSRCSPISCFFETEISIKRLATTHPSTQSNSIRDLTQIESINDSKLCIMVFQWYPWCYRGAVDVFNNDDISNIPSLLIQSDSYRQRELTGMQEYMGWGSPYSVWNPSTSQQFAMAPSTAWNEDATPQQRWGTGYEQPANLYGGDFGLAYGGDTTWRVPQHLAEDELFNDTYIGPWM